MHDDLKHTRRTAKNALEKRGITETKAPTGVKAKMLREHGALK